MTSEKQVAANRENAKKSTGPRTAEGKARCSGNAIKHGLTARERVVLKDESSKQFEAMRLCLLEEMQIGSAVEKLLLEDIAASAWRLRRIARIEVEMMEEDLLGGGDERDGEEDDAGDDAGGDSEGVPPIRGAHQRAFSEGEEVTLGARLSKRFANDNAYSRLSRYEGRIRRGMVRMVHELHVLRRQDRIENAEMWRRRRSVTGSGTEAERMVAGVTNRMYHNDDAIANCHGFVDGDEAYQDYHIEAMDEDARARCEFGRRMRMEYQKQQMVPAPAPQDDPQADGREAEVGRVGETGDREESGDGGAPAGGDAERPVAEPAGSPVGAR